MICEAHLLPIRLLMFRDMGAFRIDDSRTAIGTNHPIVFQLGFHDVRVLHRGVESFLVPFMDRSAKKQRVRARTFASISAEAFRMLMRTWAVDVVDQLVDGLA